jgi:hypothetical protein
MISARNPTTSTTGIRVILAALAICTLGLWVGGCDSQDSDLRKIGEDRYVRKDIVHVAGRISEKVDSDEFLLETPVFGQVILRPKFLDRFGLKEGDWVEVEGVFDRPAGSPRAILSEASVRVIDDAS